VLCDRLTFLFAAVQTLYFGDSQRIEQKGICFLQFCGSLTGTDIPKSFTSSSSQLQIIYRMHSYVASETNSCEDSFKASWKENGELLEYI